MVSLPTEPIMRRAFAEKDPAFDGRFFVAVKTTNVFCRPVCRAKPPRPENIEFFATAQEALLNGYRPCKLCKPLDAGQRPPPLVQRLMRLIDEQPQQRVTTADLSSLGIDPTTARRQFQSYCKTTFAAYQRSRRMGTALREIRRGEAIIDAQIDAGFESASGFRSAFMRLVGKPASKSTGIPILTTRFITSPLGPLIAVANDAGVVQLDFFDGKGIEREIAQLRRHFATPSGEAVIIPGEHPHLNQLTRELSEYFAGKRMDFTTPLIPHGSAFQMSVWEFLRKIPYGETRTYGQQAKAIGLPNAARAVGAANGQNCLAIVIPCHRVIGAGGKLTGYAGGIARKQWLLNLEQEVLGRTNGLFARGTVG